MHVAGLSAIITGSDWPVSAEPSQKTHFRDYGPIQDHRVGNEMGLNVEITNLPNPRVELEDHFFHVNHTKLLELGLQPHLLNDDVVRGMIEQAQKFRDRIDPKLIKPTVNWRTHENKVAEEKIPTA
jgi:hypothetical protein